MNYQNIILQRKDKIAQITLNRPQRLNALNEAMIDELTHALNTCQKEDTIRAIVIKGAGNHFCSGGDIQVMQEYLAAKKPEQFFQEPLKKIHRFALSITKLPKPVVAAIQGHASGAGFNLALCCDLRIAGQSAKFSQAFIKIGLIPDTGGTFLLPRIVGWAKALELCLSGEILDAREALQLGLVNQVVPDEELDKTAMTLANKLANGPTFAIGKLKILLQKSFSSTLEKQLEEEQKTQVEIVKKSQDFMEGVKAFLEKRPPRFQGK
ncbi:MAG: enoyl-CoA hydratase [Calditrichaeota bacterium]|nr:MAG: enoyl-CoA hydratase [Calditrichota bacterium]